MVPAAASRFQPKRRGLNCVGRGERSRPNRAAGCHLRTGQVGSVKMRGLRTGLERSERFADAKKPLFPRPPPSPPARPPWLCAHLIQQSPPQPGTRPGSPVRLGAPCHRGSPTSSSFAAQRGKPHILAPETLCALLVPAPGVSSMSSAGSIPNPPLLRSQVTSHRWHQGTPPHPPPLRHAPPPSLIFMIPPNSRHPKSHLPWGGIPGAGTDPAAIRNPISPAVRRRMWWCPSN